jgi:thiol-disulfide isomerase/thioredoxin
MRFFNKYYFAGLGTGIILMIALVLLAGFILVKNLMPSPEKMASILRPSEFPSSERINVFENSQDWILSTLDGTEVDFSEFKGKVIFINFWATWCKPCLAEMPGIQKLYDDMKDEDIVFLVISNETESVVKNFCDNNDYSFPFYLGRPYDSPNIFQSRSIPTTFIIDRNRRILFKHNGMAAWDDRSCRDFLRKLL